MKCPYCIYNHPFEVTAERPCPNIRLTSAQCRKIFNRDSVLRDGVQSVIETVNETETGETISPWVKAGVSRATWYRMKVNEQPTDE